MEGTQDASIPLAHGSMLPERPTRTRSRSQGHYDVRWRESTHAGADGEDNDRLPTRRPSHLRATSYTPGLRSRSRLSWDGQQPFPQSSFSRTPSPSPSRSPLRHALREPRPVSTIGVPGYYHHDARGRPTVVTDRWSYDRERMPSPPPLPPPAAYAYSVSAASSRPGTPASPGEHGGFASRPASTLAGSAPPSRPHSAVFAVADHTPGTHTPTPTPTLTLRILPPEEPPSRPKEPLKPQAYHVLTNEELDLLSRPPPLHPPMTASPPARPPSSSSAARCPYDTTPEASTPIGAFAPDSTGTPCSSSQLGGGGGGGGGGDGEAETKEHRQPCPGDRTRPHEHQHPALTASEPIPPGGCCGGLCEFATARAVGGKFGAWLLGMAIPLTFKAVSGCLVAVLGCRG
ncbi:hypothetical protein VTJ83DRAFT_5272 [Remersonia thermophila]|uniref:Uncharacterized protein n=1 Tax=Remersonia thermophila TaxID=72144 RepID=A0ABR4D761_9PEZI